MWHAATVICSCRASWVLCVQNSFLHAGFFNDLSLVFLFCVRVAAALATTAAADGKRAAARIPANLLVQASRHLVPFACYAFSSMVCFLRSRWCCVFPLQAEVHWRAAIQYADPLLEHMVSLPRCFVALSCSSASLRDVSRVP